MEIKASTIVENPKDTVVEGVITNLEIMSWSEKLKDYPKRLEKFDKPEEKNVFINFECVHKEVKFKGEQSISYSETPLVTSALGKLLYKYGDLSPGTKVRIDYNLDGKGKLRP
ncbi:MAG: hypothetical protein OEV44_00770 [Spirochaetota bacterium]|nr:hypothetical protein [Spirochaetota bacterium]